MAAKEDSLTALGDCWCKEKMANFDDMLELTNLIEEGALTYLPHISVNSAIFCFHEGLLKVLVLRMKDQPLYSLPGGFVGKKEDLDGAAQRILRERTGLDAVYLEQCGTFGDHGRTGGKNSENVFGALGIGVPTDSWIMQRFISVGYYALVNHAAARPTPAISMRNVSGAPWTSCRQ